MFGLVFSLCENVEKHKQRETKKERESEQANERKKEGKKKEGKKRIRVRVAAFAPQTVMNKCSYARAVPYMRALAHYMAEKI